MVGAQEIYKGGSGMSTLDDFVFSSKSYHGRGMFRFDRISYEHKMLLKSITKGQRIKFRNYRLIPRQVLQVLWDLDYLPGGKKPHEGMRVKVFLEFLRQGKYRDEKNRAIGVGLHDKIEQEEFPTKDLSYEVFVKGQGGKLIPISYLRKIPGTIFR
jgi:hypothetical protein